VSSRRTRSSGGSSFAGRAVTGQDAEPLIRAIRTKAGYGKGKSKSTPPQTEKDLGDCTLFDLLGMEAPPWH
jgi:hypothetical protein